VCKYVKATRYNAKSDIISKYTSKYSVIEFHITLRASSCIYLSLYTRVRNPCFTLHSFYAFWFWRPCECTLLNLRPIFFSLTPFGWLRSFTLSSYLFCHFLWKYRFLFTSDFSEIQPRRKIRTWFFFLMN